MSFMAVITLFTLLSVAYVRTHLTRQKVYLTWVIVASAMNVIARFYALDQRYVQYRTSDINPPQDEVQHGHFGHTIEPGDILLYRKSRSIRAQSIKVLEQFEDGPQTREYYHVAIAMDSQSKIESNGKEVRIEPIVNKSFDVFRPPIPIHQRNAAIHDLDGLVGEPYDWWLVVDDTLRYASRGMIHLPVSKVQTEEQHKKICTSLVVRYLSTAKWGPSLRVNVSPEDIYLTVKNYEIPGWRRKKDVESFYGKSHSSHSKHS